MPRGHRSRKFMLLLAALAALICTAPAETNLGQPRMPLLMPDDFSEFRTVFWRVEPAVPDAQNPLVEGEMPWDRGGVMTHGTVLKDPIDGRFKAWIICTPAEEELKSVVTQNPPNHHSRRLCYFESPDGVSWTRPKLPNSAFGIYKATNIVFDDAANGEHSTRR